MHTRSFRVAIEVLTAALAKFAAVLVRQDLD